MRFLDEEKINCPYCGEPMVVLIDPEDLNQQYIEDCQICCKPINFAVTSDVDGQMSLQVYGENEI